MLKNIFDMYKENGKFTIGSALQMLARAKIEFTRRSPKISHEECACRMFGTSKQTVENEHEMYLYHQLKEVEFFELMARVADEVYHASYAQSSEGAGEQPIEPGSPSKKAPLRSQRDGKSD